MPIDDATFVPQAGACHSATQATFGGNAIGLLTGIQVTTDGERFRAALDPTLPGQPFAATQSGNLFRNNPRGSAVAQYAFVGDFGDDRGVSFSVDNGFTWRRSNAPCRPFPIQCRYGSFVNQQTWYVSGGNFPRNLDTTAENVTYHSEHFAYSTERSKVRVYHGLFKSQAPSLNDYTAYVWKTSDGGQTWSTVFSAIEQGYYMNGMDCSSNTRCWAAGDGRPFGSLIVATRDGGASWSRQLVLPPGTSMSSLVMLDDNEGWACGANLNTGQATFYRTLNGQTWTLHSSVPGFSCSSLNFVRRRDNGRLIGRATGFGLFDGASSTLVFRE